MNEREDMTLIGWKYVIHPERIEAVHKAEAELILKLSLVCGMSNPVDVASFPANWRFGPIHAVSGLSTRLIKGPSGTIYCLVKDFDMREVSVTCYCEKDFTPDDLVWAKTTEEE